LDIPLPKQNYSKIDLKSILSQEYVKEEMPLEILNYRRKVKQKIKFEKSVYFGIYSQTKSYAELCKQQLKTNANLEKKDTKTNEIQIDLKEKYVEEPSVNPSDIKNKYIRTLYLEKGKNNIKIKMFNEESIKHNYLCTQKLIPSRIDLKKIKEETKSNYKNNKTESENKVDEKKKIELEKQIFYQVYQKMGYKIAKELVQNYFTNKTNEEFGKINLQSLSTKLNILLKKLNNDRLIHGAIGVTNTEVGE